MKSTLSISLLAGLASLTEASASLNTQTVDSMDGSNLETVVESTNVPSDATVLEQTIAPKEDSTLTDPANPAQVTALERPEIVKTSINLGLDEWGKINSKAASDLSKKTETLGDDHVKETMPLLATIAEFELQVRDLAHKVAFMEYKKNEAETQLDEVSKNSEQTILNLKTQLREELLYKTFLENQNSALEQKLIDFSNRSAHLERQVSELTKQTETLLHRTKFMEEKEHLVEAKLQEVYGKTSQQQGDIN